MELILHNKWKTLAEFEYSDKNPVLPPDGSVVFVHMEHIYQFFKDVAKTYNHYILISADSDYCLVEQAKHPVWFDMKKWFNFVPLTEQQGYSPVVLPARCCSEFCKVDDALSIKVYSFTRATFDNIPENIVRWFATNIDFDIPGIEHIPFGIPEWNFDKITAMREAGMHKKGHKTYREAVYVNFQNNTMERVNMKNACRTWHNVHYVENEVSHDEYVDALFNMKYVISPPGNGFDCFRTLESIYCGAVPVILNSSFNEPYRDFAIFSDHLLQFSPREWEDKELDNTPVDFGYWRDRIEKSRNLLSAY